MVAEVTATEVGFVSLMVLDVERLTGDSVAVEFAQPPGRPLVFAPGQHLTLRRLIGGVDVRRTYSLCSSAGSGRLRIAVKRIEGGALSSWLVDELQPGQAIEALPPAGSFGPRLDGSATHRYVLFAAGSGITPIASIASSAGQPE